MSGDNRDLEVRIDAALRSYAEPPATATDPRLAAIAILERAHADRADRTRRPLWLWSIPAACLLAMAVGLALRMRPAPRAPVTARTVSPPVIAPVPHSVTETTRPQPARAIPVAHRPHPRPRPLPELAVFPTPAPLTAQERQLVAFARNAPPAVQNAVAAEQLQGNKPADAALSSVQPFHPIGVSVAQLAASDKENP